MVSMLFCEGSCRRGPKGEADGVYVHLLVLLVYDLSPVPGSVVWGEEQSDVSLASGCSHRKHRASPKAAKVSPFFLWAPCCPWRSEKVEFQALKGKGKKSKPVIVKEP